MSVENKNLLLALVVTGVKMTIVLETQNNLPSEYAYFLMLLQLFFNVCSW